MTRINKNTPDNVVELYLLDFNNNKANQPFVWAKENGYSYRALHWRATKQNIILPSRSNCVLDNQIDWDSLIDIIDAHMLGYGCIVNPKKRKTSVIQNSTKQADYLEWCAQTTPFWKDCKVWEVNYFDKRTNNSYQRYWIKSKSSHYLEKQRLRWYPNGKKRLPSDIQLTPRGLLRFYIEDGGRCPHGGVIFSVHEFNSSEIEIIQQKLEELVDCKCTVWIESGVPVKLYIPKSYLFNFFETIGSCPVDSYMYKWN